MALRTMTDVARAFRARRLAAARERLEMSFHGFVEEAWPLVEPSVPFVDNWHIEEICEALEGVARDRRAGLSRDVVICVPPASTKSLLVSVLWQAWVWTWWPESRWCCSTYEVGLARRLSVKCRDLVRSEWYQSRWGVPLVADAATEWSNARGGLRIAVGTGGSITGSHFHFHCYDDLIKEQDARMGTARSIRRVMDEACGFVWSTMATRKVGAALARVMVGQRLHKHDPQGRAIVEGWESIVFPARYNPERRDPRDHRTVAGEPLCSARMDEEQIETLARSLASAARAQLDQDPTDPSGGLVKLDAFRRRWKVLPSELQQSQISGRPGSGETWLTAWDFPFKGKETSSWMVGQLWCRWRGEFYLIDQVRGHHGFEAAKAILTAFVKRHPVARKHLLEDAAIAAPLHDSLSREIPGLILEPVGGGVLVRTQAVEGLWASGSIVTPEDAPWMGGGDGFMQEHLDYTGSDADVNDQVSSSSLALLHLSGIGQSSWLEKMKKVRAAA